MHLYEYAVVRYVPSIEREEFVNIGLIMMCKRKKWLRARFDVNEARIMSFSSLADVDALRCQLVGFERVVAGNEKDGGPIAALETHERFRWLTAVRSACLQTSRPHAGLTDDLDRTFINLFHSLID